MVDAKTAQPTPSQPPLKTLKVSVVKFAKLSNVQTMRSFLRMVLVKPVHPGPCHNRMLEFVDQASAVAVKDF